MELDITLNFSTHVLLNRDLVFTILWFGNNTQSKPRSLMDAHDWIHTFTDLILAGNRQFPRHKNRGVRRFRYYTSIYVRLFRLILRLCDYHIVSLLVTAIRTSILGQYGFSVWGSATRITAYSIPIGTNEKIRCKISSEAGALDTQPAYKGTNC